MTFKISTFIRPIVLATVILPLLSSCGNLISASSNKATPEELVEEYGGPDIPTIENVWKKGAEDAVKAKAYDRAAGFYKRLSEEHPDNIEYMLQLGEMERRAGGPELAEKTFSRALELDPENISAMEGIGLAQLGRGEIERSAGTLSDVLKRDPNRWKSLNGIGIAFASRKRIDDALQYFKRALSLQPNNASILNNIGLSLAFGEKYPEATRALDMAVQSLPNQSEERQLIDMNLALVYGISGDMNGAERVLKKYFDGPEIYNNLGFYARLAHDHEMANSYLNMALIGTKSHYEKAWQNLENLDNGKRN